MSSKPSREEVEVRAYEIYLQRGGEDGHDVEDWLAAELELSGAPQSKPQPEPKTVVQPPTSPTSSPAAQTRSAAAVASGGATSSLNPRGKA